jgi:hypothetical protein
VVLETDAGPTSVFRRLGKTRPFCSKPWKKSALFFPILGKTAVPVSNLWKFFPRDGADRMLQTRRDD